MRLPSTVGGGGSLPCRVPVMCPDYSGQQPPARLPSRLPLQNNDIDTRHLKGKTLLMHVHKFIYTLDVLINQIRFVHFSLST